MPERKWKLGEDLSTSDNLLDPVTFDDLILAVHCNCLLITPDEVVKTMREMLEQRLQDTRFLIKNNMEAIMDEARKGRDV